MDRVARVHRREITITAQRIVPTTDIPSGRDRLMSAALRLVAEHGREAASSRAITIAAGRRHNSAIAYHFGSRNGLFHAIWMRGGAEVHRGRQQVIADHRSPDWSLAELVDLYVTPLADYLDAKQPSYWARFNFEALIDYPLLVTAHVRDQVGRHDEPQPIDTLAGLLEEIERIIGADADPPAALRVAVMVRAVFATFAAWERDSSQSRTDLTAAELGQSLRVTVVGILTAAGRLPGH